MEDAVRVFRYPLSIRIGYPVALVTWFFAPILPAITRYVLYSLSGETYTISFSGYLSNPVITAILAMVWLAVIYLQYNAVLSRSTVRVSQAFIESRSFLGRTRIFWSDVREIIKRRQVVRGEEVNTFFVKSAAAKVVFSGGLAGISELIHIINDVSERNGINLYQEDYESRPISKASVASL